MPSIPEPLACLRRNQQEVGQGGKTALVLNGFFFSQGSDLVGEGGLFFLKSQDLPGVAGRSGGREAEHMIKSRIGHSLCDLGVIC